MLFCLAIFIYFISCSFVQTILVTDVLCVVWDCGRALMCMSLLMLLCWLLIYYSFITVIYIFIFCLNVCQFPCFCAGAPTWKRDGASQEIYACLWTNFTCLHVQVTCCALTKRVNIRMNLQLCHYVHYISVDVILSHLRHCVSIKVRCGRETCSSPLYNLDSQPWCCHDIDSRVHLYTLSEWRLVKGSTLWTL